MNAYLTRLGICPEIQDWLDPYYSINDAGHLVFDWQTDTEIFALAFHRVPNNGCWTAGTANGLIRQIILCCSAMEGIAWLNHHPVNLDHIQLIATNTFGRLPKANYTIVFADDLLGRIYDLKAAAALAGHSVIVSVDQEIVRITFRFRRYQLPFETFSLNAFERISGYRFKNVKSSKPRRHSSWLNQLLVHGNN
ncbi:MAG: hypothetical protein ACXVJB_00165 [Mucilaginibacter sp.]